MSIDGKNLTRPGRHIAEVTIAVANGDFFEEITVDRPRAKLQPKKPLNTMSRKTSLLPLRGNRVTHGGGKRVRLGVQALSVRARRGHGRT